MGEVGRRQAASRLRQTQRATYAKSLMRIKSIVKIYESSILIYVFDGGVTTSTLQERFNGETIMKKIRNILAMALAVVMSLSIMVPAFAAETDEATPAVATATEVTDEGASGGDDGIMPLDSKSWSIGNHWQRVVSEDMSGRNIAIQVQNFNGAAYQVDIMYQTSGGREIKTEWNITGVFADKTVTCPNGTYYVYYKISPRFGWVTIEAAYPCVITW